MQRIADALDLRGADMNVQIAVLVVESGQMIDVVLQLLLVERPLAGQPAQKEAVGAGLHHRAQFDRGEGLVAGEIDLGDLDLRSFGHVEDRDRGVVRLKDGAEIHLGVKVALILIDLGDSVDRLLHLPGIENRARMKLGRRGDLVVSRANRFHPFDPDVGNLRTFDDLVYQYVAAVDVFDPGLDVLEEAHLVDGLDVLIDRVLIERLAYVLRDVNLDCVGFDALIALNPDRRDHRRGALRERGGDGKNQPQHHDWRASGERAPCAGDRG